MSPKKMGDLEMTRRAPKLILLAAAALAATSGCEGTPRYRACRVDGTDFGSGTLSDCAARAILEDTGPRPRSVPAEWTYIGDLRVTVPASGPGTTEVTRKLGIYRHASGAGHTRYTITAGTTPCMRVECPEDVSSDEAIRFLLERHQGPWEAAYNP